MISAEKQTLRVRMLESLRTLGSTGRAERSAAISAHLAARFGKEAGFLFGFAPLRLEPDWTSAIEGGWKVALPRIDGERIVFHRAIGLAELAPGPFGTREPVAGEVLPLSDASDLLVPGLAFDRSGARLGRGGGFYDRLLAETALTARRIAICFGCQLVESVPVESHDARVDAIVTEDGWIEVRSNAPGRD